ncbi:hypothetical protein AVEN_89018-1 [Araneus ventricosus]|uniref:Uncharacterized protein n=1 Tax=Araneus ventricosus TaxID=182803 RepID=A0A4Y2USC2_ARAVE|nr:hypothetical protein AVEN_89018-1 [Araneus ventricosus]
MGTSFFVPGSASVHPMVTVTANYNDQKSSDSSPNHSQVSRNSSRKSNSSILVHSGDVPLRRSKFATKRNFHPAMATDQQKSMWVFWFPFSVFL